MKRYLDPKNDYAFKKLFEAPNNHALLMSLLNCLLRLDHESEIFSVEITHCSKEAPDYERRKNILDILCTDKRGLQYSVQIQNKRSADFKKRAQFYAAEKYAQSMTQGGDYAGLKPVFLITFSEQTLFNDKEEYISCHQTLDVINYDNDLEDISYLFVELSKFQKKEEELQTLEDKWLYFFKNCQNMSAVPGAISEPELASAFACMEESAWSESEYEAYQLAAQEIIHDLDQYQNTLTKGLLERENKGIQIGKALGEYEAKMLLAKTLLGKGFSPAEVMELTALSMEQISEAAAN